VEEPKASRLREVRFPLAPLVEGKSAPERDFVLLAFSNGRYWPIPWQREAEALRARVTPGLSNVVATVLDEHLRRSLAVVCRLRRAWSVAAQRAVVPKICTQILCASEPFYASALAAEFGPGMFDPGSLTGWPRESPIRSKPSRSRSPPGRLESPQLSSDQPRRG
jgi:hypothetical protein